MATHPRTHRGLFLPVFVFSGAILVTSVLVLAFPPLNAQVSTWLLGSDSPVSLGTSATIALTLASIAHLIFAPLLAFVYWPEPGASKRREASLPLMD